MMYDKPLTFAEAQAEMLRELEARKRSTTTSSHTRREIDEARAIRRQARAAEEAPRLTLEELKAKYGENWGMQTHDEYVEQRRREIEARLHEKRNALFERECLAHGMPRDSKVSPFLWRRIQQQLADDESARLNRPPKQDMNT